MVKATGRINRPHCFVKRIAIHVIGIADGSRNLNGLHIHNRFTDPRNSFIQAWLTRHGGANRFKALQWVKSIPDCITVSKTQIPTPAHARHCQEIVSLLFQLPYASGSICFTARVYAQSQTPSCFTVSRTRNVQE